MIWALGAWEFLRVNGPPPRLPRPQALLWCGPSISHPTHASHFPASQLIQSTYPRSHPTPSSGPHVASGPQMGVCVGVGVSMPTSKYPFHKSSYLGVFSVTCGKTALSGLQSSSLRLPQRSRPDAHLVGSLLVLGHAHLCAHHPDKVAPKILVIILPTTIISNVNT